MSIAQVFQILVAGKHTILTIHDARHQIAFNIGISHALLIYDSLGRGREIIPNYIQRILNLHNLIQGNRSSRIAFDAALALAGIKVATEFFGDNIR